MDIQEKHILSKRRVGSLHGKPVIQITTRGGLIIIATQGKDGKSILLSAAPHQAVGRYIAEKKEPDIQFSELSKSDFCDLASILSVADKYSALTDKLNELMSR